MNQRFSSSNKITDAGVCKRHSGSIRILLQEETKDGLKSTLWTGTKWTRESVNKAGIFVLTCEYNYVCGGTEAQRQFHMPFVGG